MLSIQNENIDSVINEYAGQEKNNNQVTLVDMETCVQTLMLGRSSREVYLDNTEN